MINGYIGIDSNRAKKFGFISDKFTEVSYLWKKDNFIIISFIESKERGNFKKLVDNIISQNYGVKIPTPLGRMQEIVVRNNYKHTMVDGYDVWVLEAKKQSGLKLRRDYEKI